MARTKTKAAERPGAKAGKHKRRTELVPATKRPTAKSAPASAAADLAVKTHRWHPGQKAKKTIKRLQKRTHTLLPTASFERYVRLWGVDPTGNWRFSEQALTDMQTLVEAISHDVVKRAVQNLAYTGACKSLGPKHVAFAGTCALANVKGHALKTFRVLLKEHVDALKDQAPPSD